MGNKLRIRDLFVVCGHAYVILVNPVPKFNKQNALVNRSIPVSSKEIGFFTDLNSCTVEVTA